MSRPRLLVVVALLLGAGVVAVTIPNRPALAAGATITETSWWSRSPGAATPEGGFEVAKSLEGDLSVAAVRFQVEGTVSSALLVLVEASGGVRPESGVIEACPTSATWTKASPGPLESAPAAECDRGKVVLQRDGGAGTWTGDVAPLLSGGGSVGIVLRPGVSTAIVAPTPPTTPAGPIPTPVPAPTVPTPVDPGFTIELSRADVIASGTDDGSAGVGPVPTPSSSSGTGGIASGGGGGGPVSDPFGGAGFAPTFSAVDTYAASGTPTVTPTPDVLPAATPEVAAGGAGGAGTAARVENGLQPVASHRGDPPPWGRLLLLLPLSAAIGAAGSTLRRRLGPVGTG
jgi:hypothetical protein